MKNQKIVSMSVMMCLILVTVFSSGCIKDRDRIIPDVGTGAIGDYSQCMLPVRVTYWVKQTSTARNLMNEQVSWRDEEDAKVSYTYTGAYNENFLKYNITLDVLDEAFSADDTDQDGRPDMLGVALTKAQTFVKSSLPMNVNNFKFGQGSNTPIVSGLLEKMDESGDSLKMPFRDGDNVTRGLLDDYRPFAEYTQELRPKPISDPDYSILKIFLQPRIHITLQRPLTGDSLGEWYIQNLAIPFFLPFKPTLRGGEVFEHNKSWEFRIPIGVPTLGLRHAMVGIAAQDSYIDSDFTFFWQRETTVWEDAWNVLAGSAKMNIGYIAHKVSYATSIGDTQYWHSMSEEGTAQFVAGALSLWWKISPTAGERAKISGQVGLRINMGKASIESWQWELGEAEE